MISSRYTLVSLMTVYLFTVGLGSTMLVRDLHFRHPAALPLLVFGGTFGFIGSFLWCCFNGRRHPRLVQEAFLLLVVSLLGLFVLNLLTPTVT